MMDFRIFKKSMAVGIKISIIYFVLVTLFPFVPLAWTWGYALFVVSADELIVGIS